ncbi:MAG TPA: VanW family protein [Coriobacteriia bacterium]
MSDEPQAPRRSSRTRASARSTRRFRFPEGRARLAGMVALAVVGALVLAVVVDIVATQGRIHPGVRVGDVAVGSMTPAQAREALGSAFDIGSRRPVKAVLGTQEWSVTADQIGVHVDATASIDTAMAVGRTGDALAMLGQRLGALFGGASVPVLVLGDEDKAASVLDAIGAAVAIAARDASVTIDGTSVGFVNSAPGRRLDRQLTLAAISTAFVTTTRRAPVAVAAVPVALADADAQQALADARELLSGPVKVAFEGKVTEVPQVQVAGWVAFTRVPIITPSVELSRAATDSVVSSQGVDPGTPVKLVAGFDPARLGVSIASLTKGIGRPARNAAFVAEGGTVKVTPSQVGRGPDLAGLASDLARTCMDGGTRTATLRLTETQPKLTTEAARAMGVSDRISSYTTTYSSANPARTGNIHLLARAFDYKLVPPGGTFSFNGTAGARTAAKGYQEAPAIVNGKLVPQLGGGVCQVGTTFFNTVFFAGLPVVERHNHSFYISHYPKGRDATVSYGGPDMKFKNDTEGWLLIRTAYTRTSLTISLYGTDPGYKVTYTTSAFSGLTPHKVIEVKDPKLAKGVRIIEDGGVDGRRVTVVRTVLKGTKVVRTDTFVSNYKSKDETVRVGTKSASVPTTGTVHP